MLFVCWSVKGGVGTTVVSAALACLLRSGHPDGSLLVDTAGDVPGVLGLPEPDGSGLTGWLASTHRSPAHGSAADAAEALSRMEVPATEGVRVIARGPGRLGPTEAVEVLAAVLAADSRPVVADAGRVLDASAASMPLVAGADRSLLVTRACYLALRRASCAPVHPSGVILVVEPGRALGAADVESVIGAPVVAEVAFDPAVARVVDAGLLSTRLPRALGRSLATAT